MRRLMMVMLFAGFAWGASAQMTCSPVVSNCQYNGCFIAYGGLAGVYNITEAACAICNDSAEMAFFGYVRPDAGLCSSTTAASSCVGCNWCTAVKYGCPVERERCVVRQEGDCDTSPIAVAVGGPIQLTGEPVTFDIDADGAADRITWVQPETPLLALDRDGNGRIDNGAELFGTATPGSGGVNGYIALSQFDRDEDGWVTESEVPSLLLWFDANSNGLSDNGELQSAWSHLSAAGTDFREHSRVDQHGNRFAWTGWARLIDGRRTQSADVLFVRK